MPPGAGPRPPRVVVVHLPVETLVALAAGDLETANRTSPVPVAAETVVPWRSTWVRRAVQVREDPTAAAWVTGVVWDPEAGTTVGRAGFHGPPDRRGMVEVGYGIDEAQRRRGYATAALAEMLRRAHVEPRVRVVRACVSPDNAGSLAVVTNAGFRYVGEQLDPEDGRELVFERPADPV